MWFLLGIIVLCLYVYSRHRLRYFLVKGVKTPPPIPFLGNLAAVTFGKENFVETISAGYEKFKNERYFGLYQYLVPTVVPRDPELIRQIMVRDFNMFSDRGIFIDEDCDPLFGRNIIMLKGAKWRAMRSAVTPAFSSARCKGMMPLMEESAAAVEDFLAARVRGETAMDVNDITMPYVNDVIASCAFGFAVDTLKEPKNSIFRLGKTAIVQHTTQVLKFFGYANLNTLMKLLKVSIISREDTQHFCELFSSAMRARRDGSAPHRPDFIQVLVDATRGKLKETERDGDGNNNDTKTEKEGGFSEVDLVAQAVLFYSAGFDTTANLINYFMYEMAENPEVQATLQREIDEVDPGEDVHHQIQELEYLDMCVSEVLRLWPLVGSVDRVSEGTYDFGPTSPGSEDHLVAPAGVHVWVPLYSLHRDEKYWPSPSRCDPQRFSAENRQRIVPYTYLPFGTGPRQCIGSRFAIQTAKVFLLRFFRRYRTRATTASSKLCPRAFVLRPEHGYQLIVEPRT